MKTITITPKGKTLILSEKVTGKELKKAGFKFGSRKMRRVVNLETQRIHDSIQKAILNKNLNNNVDGGRFKLIGIRTK